jgi:hypothetical protein
MATRREVTQKAVRAARDAAGDYRNAAETQQHRGAVRDFNQSFGTLSRYLQATGQTMPRDLARDYGEIVARNGMLFGNGPSGGSAESELESELQRFDRYIARVT